MKKEKFTNGEIASLVVYDNEVKAVEVIEQSNYRIKTKIKAGGNEWWVETTRLRKILSEETRKESEKKCDCSHTQACSLCAESKGIDWTLIEG